VANALLDTVKVDDLRALWVLTATTGTRPGELLGFPASTWQWRSIQRAPDTYPVLVTERKAARRLLCLLVGGQDRAGHQAGKLARRWRRE
jgi:hypothetical protein